MNTQSLNRRWLLGGVVASAMVVATQRAEAESRSTLRARARAIVKRIKRPTIPSRDFHITTYGGRGDGKTDNSDAIAQALEACQAAGGGRIILPEGVCLSGPITLGSHMELHIPAGCRLKFIPEPERHLPPVHTRWEGVELMGYKPLIYAFEATDIAVTGAGTIDGSANDQTWWPWKGPWENRYADTPVAERQAADRARLFEMAEQGVPVAERVFGQGNRLRPSLFQPYRCTNVLVEGVTVVDSPFWLLHPVECQSLTFKGVTCSSHGPNNDGLDPESCQDVLIEDCVFDTGDDCVAIKAGRNADGRRIAKPCENIVIRNCQMKDGHAGLAIGSEMTGGVRNVFLQNCVMDSPHLLRALVIKTNSYRGGHIEDIHLEGIKAGQVGRALVQIWLHYEEGAGGDHIPTVNKVSIRDVRVASTDRVLVVRGYGTHPITGLELENVTVDRENLPSVVLDTDRIGLKNVRVNGTRWTQADIARLPGLESLTCDKWGICR
ncbi:MAG: glycoside hydrolase family 28 protein [Asticcacaulis sp.]